MAEDPHDAFLAVSDFIRGLQPSQCEENGWYRTYYFNSHGSWYTQCSIVVGFQSIRLRFGSPTDDAYALDYSDPKLISKIEKFVRVYR